MTDDTYEIGEDLPPPEEGVYEAELINFEDQPPAPPYNKAQWKFTFKVWTDDGAVELMKWVNRPEGPLRPKHGLYTLAEAVLGVPLAELGQLRLSNLLGKRCQVVLKHYKKDDDSQGVKIDSVLRLKKSVRSAEPEGVEPEDVPFE